MLKRITSHLSKNRKEPYSCTYGYMKSRLAITLVRDTHRFTRGDKVLASHISVIRPQWEYDTGLHLFW